MYNYSLSDYIIKDTETIIEAYWKYKYHNKILIVVDENDMFVGVVTAAEIEKGHEECDKNDSIASIVNKNCKMVQYNENEEFLYGNVRNIFADNLNINYIPILKEGNVIDLFSRQRAFWLMNYVEEKLPYQKYAKGLYNAAQNALSLGYKRISAIEFGVAGGNGLRMLESHAKEISRILNIDIETFGFDTGRGLPEEQNDYRNLPYIWQPGSYKMDVDKLKKLLKKSTLIIGDLKETLKDFVAKYNPSPIGFIAVDVDLYTSTTPILDFMATLEDKYSLPRVVMYFDDLYNENDFQGEFLAIKEFNKMNEYKKISPEIDAEKFKLLHNFKHELYNYNHLCPFELKHLSSCYI